LYRLWAQESFEITANKENQEKSEKSRKVVKFLEDERNFIRKTCSKEIHQFELQENLESVWKNCCEQE
jgi:hypothetical protein